MCLRACVHAKILLKCTITLCLYKVNDLFILVFLNFFIEVFLFLIIIIHILKTLRSIFHTLC